MRPVAGRTALVTGASRGIGAEIARLLHAQGMNVALVARSRESLEELRGELDRDGARALAVGADVTVEADRQAALDAVRGRFGAVDVLVNNAGTDHPEEFLHGDFGRTTAMVDLNVLAPLRLAQLALPEMIARGSGHVVNVSSMAGLAPGAYAVVYSTTKHALIGFSDSLRAELHGTGVGVSAVCPYFVREAGLFHDNTGGEGAGVPTVTPGQVAEAVLTAITKNRARVLVSPPHVKLTPIARALSSDLVSGIARREGSTAAMRKIAHRLRNA